MSVPIPKWVYRCASCKHQFLLYFFLKATNDNHWWFIQIIASPGQQWRSGHTWVWTWGLPWLHTHWHGGHCWWWGDKEVFCWRANGRFPSFTPIVSLDRSKVLSSLLSLMAHCSSLLILLSCQQETSPFLVHVSTCFKGMLLHSLSCCPLCMRKIFILSIFMFTPWYMHILFQNLNKYTLVPDFLVLQNNFTFLNHQFHSPLYLHLTIVKWVYSYGSFFFSFQSWNFLTRTNCQYEFISVRLTIFWVVGFILRYFLLLPLRILILLIGVSNQLYTL